MDGYSFFYDSFLQVLVIVCICFGIAHAKTKNMVVLVVKKKTYGFVVYSVTHRMRPFKKKVKNYA